MWMAEADQVSELVGDIYDASIDPRLWPRVLEQTCGYIQGIAAVLVAHEATAGSGELYFSWGDDPTYTESYNRTFCRINPLIVPMFAQGTPGDILATGDLIPYDEYFASRFYNEWAAPQGYLDTIHLILEKSATAFASVAVARHERHGLVDDATRRRMRLLAPHFQRAVAIGKVIDLHNAKATTLADTLDGMAAGMFLVDAQARIVHANASGHQMLRDGTVLEGPAGRLSAIDAQADQMLREMFAAADDGDAAIGGKGIAVPLTVNGGDHWIAHVLPLGAGARRQAANSPGAAAAVFVCKAALELPSPLETLATLYKLTPAELRVLFAVVEVGGVPEVAPLLGISETTVKTHLQRVFDKTGASRQADLVKLVAGYMSPLGG
jgi:DNA-binding CsgD family transcriptional regulator